MHLLTPEDFRSWVGRTVKVNTLPTAIEIKLDRIEITPRFSAALDHRQPFTLIFEAPLNVMLLDLPYEMDCGRGGPHSIFISQKPPLRDRRIYEAIFN